MEKGWHQSTVGLDEGKTSHKSKSLLWGSLRDELDYVALTPHEARDMTVTVVSESILLHPPIFIS